MALFHVRLVIDRTEDGEDNVIWNVFGIDTAVDPEDLVGDLASAWEDAWGTTTDTFWPWDIYFTALELVPAGGGPAAAFVGFDPPLAVGASGSGPAEVALVISHQVQDVRGIRRRGRTYVGPIGLSKMRHRPETDLMSEIGGVWTAFHGAVVALSADPVVISTIDDGAPRVSPIGLPIVSYVIDDAWDTQRSRGKDPSLATTYNF